jgi:hypothetical protein
MAPPEWARGQKRQEMERRRGNRRRRPGVLINRRLSVRRPVRQKSTRQP